MRKKFWDYMAAPSAKGLAELTTMERAFAETLKGQDKWPDGKTKGKPAPTPKAK